MCGNPNKTLRFTQGIWLVSSAASPKLAPADFGSLTQALYSCSILLPEQLKWDMGLDQSIAMQPRNWDKDPRFRLLQFGYNSVGCLSLGGGGGGGAETREP